MKFGINVPNFGMDVHAFADLALEAEQAGWDGFFLWDHIAMETFGPTPLYDPWILLTAVAVKTERIRIGPMVTPVPRRRPWKLARETVSLDHLSGGRLILGVGLGFPPDTEFERFNEDPNDSIRAKQLDEGLDILIGLWSGEPFSFQGEQYSVGESTFLPRPVQSPRIPIWVACTLPNKAPLRRAARFDGVFPIDLSWMPGKPLMDPDTIRQMVNYVQEHRNASDPFDVVIGGQLLKQDPAMRRETLSGYAEAGVTWWHEGVGPWLGSVENMKARIGQGPPEV